jgi:hypothetical protein
MLAPRLECLENLAARVSRPARMIGTGSQFSATDGGAASLLLPRFNQQTNGRRVGTFHTRNTRCV